MIGRLPVSVGLLGLLLFLGQGTAQTILEPNLSEPKGERPYEMVWANRVEPASPTVCFDDLTGWKVTVDHGAQATVQVTRAQVVWSRAVARLRYCGEGKTDPRPRILLVPPAPIPLPAGADSVDMWVYGNRWGWVNPPDTPPVRIELHLRNAMDRTFKVDLDDVRWQEWWLMHRRLPEPVAPKIGEIQVPSSERWSLESVEISGGWQTEWRDLYFDSIRFYQENSKPLSFSRRPKRNLELAEGQSPGANTGAGTLPFPTREQTILPSQLAGHYRNWVREGSDSTRRERAGESSAQGRRNSQASGGKAFSLGYEASDCVIIYEFDAEQGLSGLKASINGGPSIGLMKGGEVHHPGEAQDQSLLGVHRHKDVVSADYRDGTTLRVQIWQKSLVIDVMNRSEQVSEVKFGQLGNLVEPRTIAVPYLTYGSGPRPCVLLARAGTNHVFASLWLDWYRSNGSEPYAAESTTTSTARVNGGVRYHARTDGRRNLMFERLFITVSPVFEEVLPTVPNPVGLHAKDAVDRLWQESWGPDDYEKQMKRSQMLRAYGIEKLIQCNHEIAWRDGGESFTLRTHAAPKKGGDAALQRYVAHQRGLGWFAGLYSNYTDYAPVNEFWTPDGVQRLSDGNWRSAWPRCWAEKPLKAVEFDALLAPQIKRKYNPNSAYTDVQTAVAPWGYNDYDARVPGAGTFAQTFYAYGELLRNDSRVYGGPIFSEGYYHWLYAGLPDGNYALMYDGRPLAKEPLLPVFDLYQIHTRECDIGMGWTANFCDAIPDWHKAENLDRAIDRFLLNTMAYGHIGWLVEEEHGLDRTCRSYYMLQQVQARYGLKRPTRIAYWDGTNLVSVSKALVRDLPKTRRQLFVEYPGGLLLWFNDHPSENWSFRMPVEPMSFVVLPPAGWAAFTRDGALFSYSGLSGTNRVDYLRSPEYTYLDGRGHVFDAPEAASDGGLAVRPLKKNRLQISHISGTRPFVVRRPYRTHGACVSCEAFDVEGKPLGTPVFEGNGNETCVTPQNKAITYSLSFGSPVRTQTQRSP
jgi:hypothetical protein